MDRVLLSGSVRYVRPITPGWKISHFLFEV